MVTDNDVIDDGVLKVGMSNEKMQYGSIINEEAIPLVGERKDDHVDDLSEKKSGFSRLGLAGFFVLALALSSALSMSLGNRSQETGMTTEVGLVSSSASSSSATSSSSLLSSSQTSLLVNREKESGMMGEGGLLSSSASSSSSRGTGHPIFVVEGSETCPASILEAVDKKAEIFGAKVIFGEFGEELLKTIADVRKKLACSPDITNPDYCLAVTVNCGSTDDSLLTINVIDDDGKVQKFGEVDYEDPVGATIMQDIIVDTAETFDVLARPANATDGVLKQPYAMETVKLKPLMEGREGTCPGADWTELVESDPNVKVYHLTIETGIHKTVADKNGKFLTRLMNGIDFGPYIRITPGETFRVFFENKLEDIDGLDYNDDCDNKYCSPNYSNLHYHGAHVNGDEPSDDVELSIPPGGCYQYESKFPEYHMPGSHWIHPHFHGNSALQVGGGAAMPFIVEDNDNFPLPPEVRSATDTERDVKLFIQHINYNETKKIIRETYLDPDRGEDEDYFQFEPNDGFNIFRFVNGQYNPSLNIETGTWYRFRIFMAGWDSAPLNLDWKIKEGGCEQYLLAKDGIYIKDYPRKLDTFPVPTSGRADIMIRCTAEGNYTVTTTHNANTETDSPLMTIASKGDLTKPLEDPTKFGDKWQFPAYLDNFVDVPHGDGCNCTTNVFSSFQYFKRTYLHYIQLGQVIERNLRGITGHPYHQHVYPFQLSSGFHEAGGNEYFQIGDWHDVIRAGRAYTLPRGPDGNFPPTKMKFHASATHEGKMMFHCHRLEHEDKGMMNKELITSVYPCQCDVTPYRTKPPTPAP